jgi:hypothetical protein
VAVDSTQGSAQPDPPVPTWRARIANPCLLPIRSRAHHNSEAERELLAIAPYPGELAFDRIGIQRKWLMFYGGLTYGRTDFSSDSRARLLSPDHTQKALDLVNEGSLYSVSHLLSPLEAFGYESVTRFKCPIFLLKDGTTMRFRIPLPSGSSASRLHRRNSFGLMIPRTWRCRRSRSPGEATGS